MWYFLYINIFVCIFFKNCKLNKNFIIIFILKWLIKFHIKNVIVTQTLIYITAEIFILRKFQSQWKIFSQTFTKKTSTHSLKNTFQQPISYFYFYTHYFAEDQLIEMVTPYKWCNQSFNLIVLGLVNLIDIHVR